MILISILAIALFAVGCASGSVNNAPETAAATDSASSSATSAPAASDNSASAAATTPSAENGTLELTLDQLKQYDGKNGNPAYVAVDGVIYDSVTMAIDYDTGAVYDRYSVDESWLEKSEKEQAIYIAAEGGCFPDNYYSGEPIFLDSETHISLSDSDIAEINQALRK